MLVIEIDKEVIAQLRKKTRLRGSVAKMIRDTKIDRNTIKRVQKNGTATEEVAEKIANYLNA